MHESDFTRMYTCYMTYGKAINTYPETTTSAAENSSTTNDPPTGMYISENSISDTLLLTRFYGCQLFESCQYVQVQVSKVLHFS